MGKKTGFLEYERRGNPAIAPLERIQNFNEFHPPLPEEERLEISNSLRYVRQYCEMPLKILKAEQLVGGEEAMDRILRGLFNRELDPMYPYLTYQEFLDACGLTEEDLNLA